MMKQYFVIICGLMFAVALQANAAEKDKLVETAGEKQNSAVKKDENPLGKFNFGVALGFENYKGGYVNEAEINGTNRIVRIIDSQKQKLSLWLETHYIWDGMARTKLHATHSAPGFYIGVRAIGPDSDAFDAFSLGLMWAFKRTPLGEAPPAGQIAESINIGIGPVWHRTKKLASGIVEGQALPAEYQEIRFDKRDEDSWLVMISIGF